MMMLTVFVTEDLEAQQTNELEAMKSALPYLQK